MGYTALGKKIMLEDLFRQNFHIRIYNSSGEMLDGGYLIGTTFLNNGDTDSIQGAYKNETSIDIDVGSEEDVKYVGFLNPNMALVWLHELNEAIDFPTGGTYKILQIICDLNEGGNHSEPYMG